MSSAKDTKEDNVVLYYFPARGRAEQIRLALAEAGVTFVDENFDMGDAEAMSEFFQNARQLGGNLTTNVPMLYMDGKCLTQSNAILKYVARKYKLYPETGDILQMYDVDNLMEAAEDLRAANYKPMAIMGGTADDIEAYKETNLPKHLQNFVRILGDRDYFASDGNFTVADLSVYDALDVSNRQLPNVLEEYPTLQTFHARVEARPNIAKWLASEQRAELIAFPALE